MTPEEMKRKYIELLGKKRDKGLENLYFFNKYVLEGDKERRKYLVPHVHREWSDWHKNSKKRIKMILVPRNCFKTTFFTVGQTLQEIAADRNSKILISNATLKNAQNFLSEIKEHLRKNKTYQLLYEGKTPFYDPKLKWNEDEIIVGGRTINSQTPTVTAIGVGGNLVSQHYDKIINDDLVNLENSSTKLQANKVIDWWKKSHSLLNPDGEMLILGTRWSYYELYSYIQDHPQLKNEVDMFIKSIYNEDGSMYFPERFDDAKVEELKMLHGSYSFSAFYLNDPIDDDKAIIKESHLRYYVKPPGVLNVFAVSDPAMSQGADSDFSTITVVGIDWENNWYILKYYREKLLTNDFINRLFDVKHEWNPITTSIELVSQAQGLLDPIHNEEERRNEYLNLFEIKVRNEYTKQIRIRSVLQPRFERGKIFIKEDMVDLKDEILRFPKAKHDDIIDPLTDIETIGFAPDRKDAVKTSTGSYFEDKTAGIIKPFEFEMVDPELGEFY